MVKGSRPPTISDERWSDVRAVAAAKRGATVQELRDEFSRPPVITVCTVTMHRAWTRAGLEHTATRGQRAALQAERLGCTQAHRKPSQADRSASCRTDAECALAADLLDHSKGARRRLAKYDRRAMVDACCHVLRTGCGWTMLPKSFPRWLAVHKSFSRWAEQSKSERLRDRLRQQWPHRLGRNAETSAAVINTPCHRLSPQG